LAKQSTKRKTKTASNGELPFTDSDAPCSVAEFLKRQGKELTLKSAQSISRGRWVVLGQCKKTLPLEVLGELMVVPRGQARAALERDDVLLRLIEHREKYGRARVHSLAEVASILPKARQAEFRSILAGRAASRPWPAQLAFLPGSKDGYLFLRERVVQSSAVSSPVAVTDGDFARAFSEAFDRLRRDRPFNMVELAALRHALSGYSREQFDGGLRELRQSREFVLRAFEGRHGSLTPEEMAAAIREDGRVFAYAARANNG
jgi:hypothetical protein